MSLIVANLIPEFQSTETLVTATADMSVQRALERMVEHDFSQLPVVDQEFKLIGLITSDSILRAISNLQCTPDKIAVSHATAFKVKTCRLDDDISELLNGLRDVIAVPVVDKAGKLVGIVTNYDAAEYYRQRAEDIMLAEDIETTLKEYIKSAYKDPAGDFDHHQLNQAIQNITPSSKALQNRFKKALSAYLQKASSNPLPLDPQLGDNVFHEHLHQKNEAKPFEDLTLAEYIQLFQNVWEKYKSAFVNLDWVAMNNLLNEVRQTRNAIAHFREVTPNQRKQLKFCADFLDHHFPSLEEDLPDNLVLAYKADLNVADNQQDCSVEELTTIPLAEEEPDPRESRYARLALWLEGSVEAEVGKIVLSFPQIQEIIRDELPLSARQHRTWWINNISEHAPAQQWFDAGWKVSDVNISKEKVVFSRLDNRQNAYINFFITLVSKVQAIQGLQVEPAKNPPGRHWFCIKVTSDQIPEAAWIIFAFGRKSRFRIENYIDLGRQDLNKCIFDTLYRFKPEIEVKLGEPLGWERMDGKRAARVALYREKASITQTPAELAELQDWAVSMMPQFYRAVTPDLHRAIQLCQSQTESF